MAAVFLLAFVTAQRLAELGYARANTRRLLAKGAREEGADHYPWLVAFHAAWLLGLWIFGPGQEVQPFWLAVFLVLQGLRAWVLLTLGRRWTTRILVVPGEKLVRRGPYRFLSHPNYVVVAGEIAALPLALGLSAYAVLASVIHFAVLAVRIEAEERALAGAPDLRRSVPDG